MIREERNKMRKMKDSGIEWIGEIPEDWDVIRLRYLCEIFTGNQDTQDNVSDGIYPFYVRSPIVEKSNKYTFEGPAILMAGDGVGAGKIFHYVDGKYGCHQRVYSLQHIHNVNRRYLYYYLQNLFYISIETANTKSTVDSVRLSMLQDFPIAMPTFEQQKIADFLDEKVSQIDSTISKTRESIEEYKKLKQAIITEAVTGKNEKVEGKSETLPDGWKWIKLKYLVKKNLQYGANESGIEFNSSLPRYIRITDIDSDGKLKSNEMLSLLEESSKDYLLEDGDILFARSGASVGKTFIYKSEYGKCCFAGYLIRAKLNNKIINPKYFFYYTLSSKYDVWKNGIFIQSTIQNIGADKYSNLEVPVPPLTSQLSLITYLDQKCSEIDNLITKKEQLVVELETYKKSLIYEVVTGKRSVI